MIVINDTHAVCADRDGFVVFFAVLVYGNSVFRTILEGQCFNGKSVVTLNILDNRDGYDFAICFVIQRRAQAEVHSGTPVGTVPVSSFIQFVIPPCVTAARRDVNAGAFVRFVPVGKRICQRCRNVNGKRFVVPDKRIFHVVFISIGQREINRLRYRDRIVDRLFLSLLFCPVRVDILVRRNRGNI